LARTLALSARLNAYKKQGFSPELSKCNYILNYSLIPLGAKVCRFYLCVHITTSMTFFSKFLLAILLSLFCNLVVAQEYTISGRIENAQSEAPVVGASIFLQGTQVGTTSDDQGKFELSAAAGNYKLIIRHLGLQDIEQDIELKKNLKLDFKSKPSRISTGEVIITAEGDNNLDQKSGTIELSAKDIAIVPDVLGESDLIKTVQLLPGVTSATDGNTGFYVRGGGPDQNLILLDGASIYNASHLLGFYSVFNTSSIDNIKLIKGSMPANYGGRLSSVLDITTIDGNDSTTTVAGGIGLVATNATIQGPIKKGKSSYFISGRRTYIDVVARPFLTALETSQQFGYFFYDLNGKITLDLTEKDKIYFSGYFGRDVFSVKSKNSDFELKTQWGNSAAIIGYRHIFSEKLLLRSSVNYTSYTNKIKITQEDIQVKLSSGINDLSANLSFHYFPNSSHHIDMGANYTHHDFLPSNLAGQAEALETIDLENQIHFFSHDLGLYALDAWAINKRVMFEYGVRFSFFQHIGPFDRYVQGVTGITEDTISFAAGDKIAQYINTEPRFSLRLKTKRSSAWKLSFAQNYQYIHLATYATVSLPTDVWIPSTDLVKPQFSTQYSVGNFKTYETAGYELSLVGYFKLMKNQIEYKDGFSPEDDVLNNVDNNLIFGEGKAFGTEFYLKKVKGKTTGWLGYTISTTKRTFEDINEGAEFLAKYDRLHDLSLVIAHELSNKWKFSMVFIYASGNATTMPIARYTIEGKIITQYNPRNSFRMPAYHRLDLSATYTPEPKKKKKYESIWKFAIYNLYNRANPYFIYFDNSKFNQDGLFETKAKQVSLFPVMPSVSWNFSF